VGVTEKAVAEQPPSAALADARIKGAHTRAFLAWYTAQGGQARTTRLLERMPERYRSLFDPGSADLGLLDSFWYPAEAMHIVIDAMLDGLDAQTRSRLAREGARAATEATLKGVHRWIFERVMTPERYLPRAQLLFSRYYQPGEIVKTEPAPFTHLSVFRGWTGHHPFICEMLFHSAIVVYGAMGCRGVSGARLRCLSEGAPDCAFSVCWAS